MADETEVIKLSFQADTAGMKAAATAIMDVNGRLRDAKGRFLDMGASAKKAGADATAGANDAAKAAGLWQRMAQAGAAATRSIASGVNGIGAALGGNAYRMQLFGQFVDDLQYVPEMGLRPIVGQLVQMNPLLGTTVILGAQLVKHSKEVQAFGKGLADFWGLDELNSKSSTLAGIWENIGIAVRETGRFATEFGEGVDAMTNGPQMRAAQKGGAFMSVGPSAQQDAGKAMAAAIDEYGRHKALAEIVNRRAQIDPALKPGAPGQEAEIQKQTAHLVDLIEKAQKGDQGAILGLKQRMEGTGIGAAVARSTPGGIAARKDQEAQEKRLAGREADEMNSKAEGFAQDMQAHFTRNFLEGIKQSEATVEEELGKSMPKAKAAWFANQVYTLLDKQTREAIEGKARALGITNVEAIARLRTEMFRGDPRGVRPTLEQQMGKRAVSREDQIMTRISDRTNSQGVVDEFLVAARENRFRDVNYQRKFGRMGFEAQLDETSKLNARDDEMARQLEQRRLTKLGYSPARAAKIAEENVNMARKALNGETQDVESKQQNKLIDNVKELNETLRDLNRRGLVARFG